MVTVPAFEHLSTISFFSFSFLCIDERLFFRRHIILQLLYCTCLDSHRHMIVYNEIENWHTPARTSSVHQFISLIARNTLKSKCLLFVVQIATIGSAIRSFLNPYIINKCIAKTHLNIQFFIFYNLFIPHRPTHVTIDPNNLKHQSRSKQSITFSNLI